MRHNLHCCTTEDCCVRQVSNVLAILPSPYPKHGLVEVINQTTQVINSDGGPVPLSEVRIPTHPTHMQQGKPAHATVNSSTGLCNPYRIYLPLKAELCPLLSELDVYLLVAADHCP